jgi:uncharacterized membrane protein YhaH (DUF805 family)
MVPGSIIYLGIDLIFGPFHELSTIGLMLIAVFFWPAVAVGVKRWHDIDVSGWWVLINVVPYVGWLIALLFNGFSRGSIGRNRFGPDPIREFPNSHPEAL